MHAFLQDFRFSLRQLRKSPGFALTVILTLALGVGANVVVFSVLNALVLRPLNLPHSDTLYNISRRPFGWDTQSYPDYLDYRDRNNTFSGIAGYTFEDAGVSEPGTQQSSVTHNIGYTVSGNYFDVLEVQPELGRFFHSVDEHGPNSAPLIVLSHAFWHGRFNSDSRIIGSVINLDKHPFTVVGVAPESFHGTELFMQPDFWVPMVNEQQLEGGGSYLNDRHDHTIYLIGRLKPSITAQQATDNLNAIAKQLARIYPEDDGLDAKLAKPGLLGSTLGTPTRAFLFAVMLMALLVLLAACANLASIFAARTADRTREIAIRLAIGSGRRHILRELLAEAITVALIGGAVGLTAANALLRLMSQWQPITTVPIRIAVNPDFSVYAVALLLSLASGVFFGLLPSRQIWKIDASQAMKSGSSILTGFHRLTLRDVLLLAQICICTLLVMSSFVALRGMMRSLHADFGFNPQNVTLVETDFGLAGYTDAQAFPLQKRLLDQVAQIPGVTSVSTSNNIPLGVTGYDQVVFRPDTSDLRVSSSVLDAARFTVSPGYLEAAQTHLLAGRNFTWHDDENSPKVAIINNTFARIMFRNQSAALGQRFKNSNGTVYQVVGVVEDGKYRFLTEDSRSAMFIPLAQDHNTATFLIVRSQILRPEIASGLRRVLSGLDPRLPYTIHSWQDSLAFALFPARVATVALGVMGLLAAMLAITGIFGMASYSVSKRMKELGIRIALGAQPMQVMRAALERPVFLLLGGSIAGLVLCILASGVLAHIVYQATPRDPVVLLGMVLTMTLLGVFATWIPARRAQSIDPARLLRDE
ncbi:MAG TPA: ABC transporter permease [Pseudacidobacterium sp.]|nr:ABC transporter permease [Pseudacidobacterium sp.]